MNFSFLRETVLQNCKLQTGQPHLYARKVMEQILLEDISRHVDDREMIKDSQNGCQENHDWLIWGFMAEWLNWWIREEKLMSSSVASLRPLKLFHRKSLLLNWRGKDLMDEVLHAWQHPKGCSQWLNVQRISVTSGVSQGEDFPYGSGLVSLIMR